MLLIGGSSNSYVTVLSNWIVDSPRRFATYLGCVRSFSPIVALSDGGPGAELDDLAVERVLAQSSRGRDERKVDVVSAEVQMPCSSEQVQQLSQLRDGRLAVRVAWEHQELCQELDRLRDLVVHLVGCLLGAQVKARLELPYYPFWFVQVLVEWPNVCVGTQVGACTRPWR